MPKFDKAVTESKHRDTEFYGNICIGEWSTRLYRVWRRRTVRPSLEGGDTMMSWNAFLCVIAFASLVVDIIALFKK